MSSDYSADESFLLELIGAATSVQAFEPRILCRLDETRSLPVGKMAEDRTLEQSVRAWMDPLLSIPAGYLEQLYTFGNRFRDPAEEKAGQRSISVAYLVLCRESTLPRQASFTWTSWYYFLPWEDHREGRPESLDLYVIPALLTWADHAPSAETKILRRDRIEACFGLADREWDPEWVLPRYELLYEAGLVREALRDWEAWKDHPEESLPIYREEWNKDSLEEIYKKTGKSLSSDHRRIMASAIGRLRGKIKYRPVVFELVPDSFTLLQLQKTVEALSGVMLHKQNFRRLLQNHRLVEETGGKDLNNSGRPAGLYQFRRSVLKERLSAGIGLPKA